MQYWILIAVLIIPQDNAAFSWFLIYDTKEKCEQAVDQVKVREVNPNFFVHCEDWSMNPEPLNLKGE